MSSDSHATSLTIFRADNNLSVGLEELNLASKTIRILICVRMGWRGLRLRMDTMVTDFNVFFYCDGIPGLEGLYHAHTPDHSEIDGDSYGDYVKNLRHSGCDNG